MSVIAGSSDRSPDDGRRSPARAQVAQLGGCKRRFWPKPNSDTGGEFLLVADSPEFGRDGLWLCPIEDRRRLDSPREGMLEGFSLGNYLLLVDYTGRLFRDGKAVISAELGAILERLGSSAENWQARLRKLAGGRCWVGSSRPRDPGCGKWPSAWACIAWPTWPGAWHAEAGRNRKAVSRLEVLRVPPPSRSRCRHFGSVSLDGRPNPLVFHISAESNCLSFSSRLPELTDQANGRIQPVWCWLPRRSYPAAMPVRLACVRLACVRLACARLACPSG